MAAGTILLDTILLDFLAVAKEHCSCHVSHEAERETEGEAMH